MNWLKKNYINILVIYINIIFIALAIFDAYQLINTDLPYIFAVITGGIVLYYAFNLILSRMKNKKLFILLCIILLIGTTIFFKDEVGQFIYNRVIIQIDVINGLLVEQKSIDFYHFKNIFMISIPIIVFVILSLSTIGRLDYILFMNLGVLAFLWVLGYTETIEKLLLPFAAIIGFTLGVNNHNLFMKKIANNRIRHGVRPVRIVLPLLLITIIAAFITSYISYSNQGKYYTDIFQKLRDIVITYDRDGGINIGNRKFTLKSSGYNDSSVVLGGSITISHDEVLEVESDKPLYLKGSSKDIYDGKTWDGTFGNGIKRNYFHVKDDVSEIDINNQTPTSIHRISIKPLTGYRNLFVPINTASIEADRVIYVNDRTKTAYFDNFNEEEYTIEYNEYTMPSNGMIEKNTRYQAIVAENFSEELQLYSGITPRTKTLVSELIRGMSTDMEVVNAIEEYISDNYSYSLNVAPIPEGQDFVDYYLFDTFSGYCVYSASAVTIMLRIAGIPARYVEGFKTSESSKVDGVYTVTNADAHAWTEAYIFDGESYRWVTVDASTTPAELQEEQDNDEEGTNGADSPDNPDDNGNNSPSQGPVVDPAIENPIPEEEGGKVEADKGGIPKVFIYSAIAIVAILLLGRVLYKIIIIFYIIRTEDNKALYSYFIKRLRRYGYKKEKGITDREFIQSIDNKELMVNIMKLLDMVYAEHFGGMAIKADKKRLYKDIEGSIKNLYGKSYKYYLFKYLL
ncbi:transglutaminase domain-containing protein [Alloiococcus sp. CFN-8]|uniref:transglutaminase domain-containing protein n=1 Tax=Alloiococcus sp. CFN-8 TaxID=3416081 RepID=UPI003CE90123